MTYIGKGTVAGSDVGVWSGTAWLLNKKTNSQSQAITATGSWDGIADIIYVTGAGAKTITLPLPSALPRRVTIVDAANTAEQNPITVVAAGGGFINGQASFLINKRGAAAIFDVTSLSGSGSWQVVAQGINYAENVVVWRPSSSVVRPNVFTTLTAALAAAKSSLGPGRIYLDASDSSTFAVAAAAHDFEGRISIHATGNRQIDFALNASFNNVPEIRCDGQLTLSDGATADTNNSILRITQVGLIPIYENVIDSGSNVRRFIRVDTSQAAATERSFVLVGSTTLARADSVESDGALRVKYQGFGPHTVTAGAFVDEASHGEDLSIDVESSASIAPLADLDDSWSGTVNLSYLTPGIRLAPATITGTATLEGTHGRDQDVEVDSTGGAFTLTLPPVADVAVGDRITVKDVGGDATANNVTVDANGSTIDGSGTVSLDADFAFMTFRKNSAGAWSSVLDVSAGAAGADGATGAVGGATTIHYTFSTTTTDVDPGSGVLRLDNATQNVATVIRADLLDDSGADVTSILDTFDDPPGGLKGFIRIVDRADPSKWLLFSVSTLSSPSGYRNITVTNIGFSAASPFSDSDEVALCFDPMGAVAAIQGFDLTDSPVWVWNANESLADESGNALDLSVISGTAVWSRLWAAKIGLLGTGAVLQTAGTTIPLSTGEITIYINYLVHADVPAGASASEAQLIAYAAPSGSDTDPANNTLYQLSLVGSSNTLQLRLFTEDGAGVNRESFSPSNVSMPAFIPTQLAFVRQSDGVTWSVYVNGRTAGSTVTHPAAPAGGTNGVLWIASSQAVVVGGVKICLAEHSESQVRATYNRTFGPAFGFIT